MNAPNYFLAFLAFLTGTFFLFMNLSFKSGKKFEKITIGSFIFEGYSLFLLIILDDFIKGSLSKILFAVIMGIFAIWFLSCVFYKAFFKKK